MRFTTNAATGSISVVLQTDKGERTIDTSCTNMRQARQVAREAGVEDVEVLAKAGILTKRMVERLTPGGSLTCEETVLEWGKHLLSSCSSVKTATLYIQLMKSWCRKMGVTTKRLHLVVPSDCSNWINADDGVKLETRKGRLAALMSFTRYCIASQYPLHGHISLIRIKRSMLSHEQKERGVRVPFTDAEVVGLLAYLKGKMVSKLHTLKQREWYRFWYCAVVISKATGLRLIDVASIEPPCIDLEKNEITVWTSKSSKRLTFALDDELKSVLETMRENKTFLFPKPHKVAMQSSGNRLSPMFKVILRELGIENKSFHCLRHKRLSDIVNNGGTLEGAAKFAGHSSTKTTEGYCHKSI